MSYKLTHQISRMTLPCIFFIFLLMVTLGIPMVEAGPGPDTGNWAVNRIKSFNEMPPGLVPALVKALQNKLPAAYQLNKSGDGFRTENQAHGMKFIFTPVGVKVQAHDKSWQWGMTFSRWGREGTLRPVPAAELFVDNGRLTYQRKPALTEWYLNTAWGLEQGFTLNHRPSERDDQSSPVVLELILTGTLRPELKADTLVFVDTVGRPQSRYTGLHVYDAKNQSLPARLILAESRLRILVDDRTARYPITIDPWVQQAKLNNSDAVGADIFGCSVAISGDIVVAGAEGHDIIGKSSQGAAYVFEKPVGGWTDMIETAKLTASDGEASDYLGISVAISGDTIVVGAYGDDISDQINQGSAYVFVKPPGGWVDMTETAKLTASDGAAEDWFGGSVGVSGNTVVVGAQWHDTGGHAEQGAAYVFVRPAGGWVAMTETAKLTSDDGAINDRFGCSVAVTWDSAVIGAYNHDTDGHADQGAAYVFVEPAGGWVNMTQTAKLTASDGESYEAFGYSVAFDFDTVVVGARSARINIFPQGAAYVFVKPIPGWTDMTETARLMASDGEESDDFGKTVAISGETIVVGANWHDIGTNNNQGSAYIFEKPLYGWTNMVHTAKLTANDGAADDEFGCWVGISGETVVVGAFFDDVDWVNQGSAYIFELAGSNDELAVDFGSNGLWHYNGVSWSKKTNWDPDDDLAGWSGGLAVDFGTNGLWNYDGYTWNKKTSWDAGSGGMAGWSGVLAMDFDGNGLWTYDGTFWTKKTSWDPDDDLVDWSGGLAVDFGTNGLWNYDGNTWNKKTSWDAGSGGMADWFGGLAVDFDGSGLWNYDGSIWSKKTSWDAGSGGLCGWAGGLAVDFDGNGLWNYDGSRWSKKTSWDPEGISALGSGFAADFGANGLWYYDGATWSKKTNWNAENLTDVDLY